MIDITNPATLIDEDEHRRASYLDCERCGKRIMGYCTSSVDRKKVCLECRRAEGAAR